MDRQALGKTFLASLIILTVTACGGGGGQSSPDVAPGPAPPGGSVPAPDPIQPVPGTPDFETAGEAFATITGVTVDSPPVVDFTLVDEQGVAIADLTSGNVRFTVAKLIPSENGSSTAWQSYINQVKVPAINPDNPSAIQATSERNGELVNHGDGTYSYTFVTDIASVTDPMVVPYEPDLTHRVGIQFSGGPPVLNPTFDWMPSNGATSGILTRNIVAIENCNTCHDPLALHGGGRRDTKYCVTCHNPGSSEPNSLNTIDFKVMVHKIHRGADLPSVQAGGEYVIYGFRDSKHDYSNLHFPQDIRNCTNCHAGSATGSGNITLTADGDNWNEVPTRAACGSCHDDVDFSLHNGGQIDDSNCLSCHSEGGARGSIAESHRNLSNEFIAEFKINILDVTNSAPGEFPVVTLSITNPLNNNAPYDILNDPEFDGGRVNMGVAWSTEDYNNVGNGGVNARHQVTNVLSNATAVGDGTFTVVSQTQIPDGSVAPFVAATGSGAIIVEGRARKDLSQTGTPAVGNVPLTFGVGYFSIDEANGAPVARRRSVAIENCNVCHGIKINHGGNRANDTQGCVGCHNPRLTDKVTRDIAQNPPTDGKDEVSLDFKRLIHGVHSGDFRENPLQVVGFGGFSTHVFDEDEVRFPGTLSNCRTCHVEGAWRLPLAEGVLASTIDTGSDSADPNDDVMITPTAAVCSSCHDGDLAQSHMEQNGGDFSATLVSIDSGASTETCAICHGPGRIADLDVVHGLSATAPPPLNFVPTSNAGIDQVATEGAMVTLSGSGGDADGTVTYLWKQTLGPDVTLVDADMATASFTAPVLTSSADLVFMLTVTDDTGAAVTSTVTISVGSVFEVANGINGGRSYSKFWAQETGFTLQNSNLQNQSELDAITSRSDFFRCKQCHGWDRLGREGGYSNRAAKNSRPNVADLNLANVVATSTIEELFDAVKTGFAPRRDIATDLSTYDPDVDPSMGDMMPDYSQILTDEQLWELVKYLKEESIDTTLLYDITLGTGVYPNRSRTFSNLGKDGDAANGDSIFASNCAGCHGSDGRLFLVDGGSYTIGGHLRKKPYEDQHKVKFGHLGSSMGAILANASDSDIVDLYKALADPTKYPTEPAEFSGASGINGGRMYSKFWATETGFTLTNSNLQSQAELDAITSRSDFFRCKQCHGWDRLGREGGYSDRAPKTSRPNVADLDLADVTSSMSVLTLFDAIKSGSSRRDISVDLSSFDPAVDPSIGDMMPDYSQILSDSQIWDLVSYLKDEAIDTTLLYDITLGTGVYPNRSRTFSNLGKDGDAANGDAIYATNCAGCHGADGTLILVDGGTYTIGAHLRKKPYEDQHKVKFGHLGSIMGSILADSPVSDIVDLYKALNNSTTYPD